MHLSQDATLGRTKLTAQIYHAFPAYDFTEITDSLENNRLEVWLPCPVKTPQESHLWVNDTKLRLYMTPGDTIHIQIKSLPISANRFLFTGKTKVIQEYYLAYDKRFPVDPSQLGMNIGTKTTYLNAFRQPMDSLLLLQSTFWHVYQQKHQLPSYFIRFESDRIRYTDAYLRLYMLGYQEFVQKKKQTVQADYFRFLRTLPLQNRAAEHDDAYLKFLMEYFIWKIKADSPVMTYSQLRATALKRASQLLPKEVIDYFKLWWISYDLQSNPVEVRQELAKTPVSLTYQYLVKYLNAQAGQRLKTLQAGDKAPNFFLTDQSDSLRSLAEFKGKIVYLCFWFAGCKGCVEEFPYENQLVEQFKGQPVQIVSICTRTKDAQWRQISAKAKLQTLNLFANSDWQQTLEKKFAIQVYPHYILIGRDGRVLENFASRPSGNIAAKIKAALKKVN
ncbi:hypothetical protein GCM10027423_63750 [Spirosoma arcticum]